MLSPLPPRELFRIVFSFSLSFLRHGVWRRKRGRFDAVLVRHCRGVRGARLFSDPSPDSLMPFLDYETNPSCLAIKSFAGEVKSDSREIAANAVECAPEIGGFAVGVVENYGCGVELLREASGASETQTLSLRPSRNPCESEIGDKVIVIV